MKRKFLLFNFLLVSLAVLYFTTTSSSSGISGSSTSCAGAGCHAQSNGTAINVTVGTAQSTYTPGQTYAITVSATNTAYAAMNARGGFKFSVSAGTLSGAPANTSISGSTIGHTAPQICNNGTVTWSFNWTAPSAATTSVTMNTAVNITNNNNASSGDAWNSYSMMLQASSAPQAPSIQNVASTSVTSNSAAVNAQVNANGAATSSILVEYGLTTSYGSSVTTTPASVGGSSYQNVSANLSSLTPLTTYHYRIKAVNMMGTTYSNDYTFTTLAQALVPSYQNISASAITSSGAGINAEVNPNYAATSNIIVEYGLSTAYGSTTNMSPMVLSGSSFQTTTATLSGLSPNTTYHYRITGTNSVGTSSSADYTFTTLNNVAPPTVNVLATSGIGANVATVNGTVNANNATASVSLEYGLSTAYGSMISMTPPTVNGNTATNVSANLSALLPNTTYHFRIVASNAQGTTNSNDSTFTTSSPQSLNDLSTLGLSLFPNPAQELLTISGATWLEEKDINLVDGLGRNINCLVQKQGDVIVLHLGQIPAGIYQVRLQHKDKAYFKKFQKI